MNDWVWEYEHLLKGTGNLVGYDMLFSSRFVENLHFNIEGKLASNAELSKMVKRILETELKSRKSIKQFLPASILELVMNALWRIKIKNLKVIRLNDRYLTSENYLDELCKRVYKGEKVNQLFAVMFSDHQNVDIRLKFRNRNVSGIIKFENGVKERYVNRFTKYLDDLAPMFWKDKLPYRRERKAPWLAELFIPRRDRSIYHVYELPSGHYLDDDFSYKGGSSGSSANSFNVTKKE